MVLTMLIWAGNHVLGRWAAGHIPPMTLAFLRWSLAALVMLPLARHDLRRDMETMRRNVPLLLLLGLMGSGLYNTLQYVALTTTTVSNAAILNSWAPILIAVFGALFFQDRLRWMQAGGILMSLAGVLVVILHGDPARLSSLTFNRGDLIMLMATSIWALYTTLLRLRPAISTLSFAAVTYAIAGFANLPLAIYEHTQGLEIRWSPEVVAAILYAGLLASVLAYYLYAAGVETLGPTRAGAFIHLVPLFASALALLLIGEAPELYHFAGFALIVAGVATAVRGRPRHQW